jgi:environmental stress-induced protein Ves
MAAEVRLSTIAFAAQRVVPWRNGGGHTREVAIEPPQATVAGAFDWRISRATVAADGPFSTFAGVDRSLWLWAGRGIELDVDGRTVRLDAPLQRVDFRGESTVRGRLIDGAIEDCNVMAARDRIAVQADAWRLDGGARRDLSLAAGTTVVVALDAPLVACGRQLAAGDAVRIDAAAAARGELRAGAAPCAVLVATFTARR